MFVTFINMYEGVVAVGIENVNIFGNPQLENKRTLKDYNIRCNSTIRLLKCPSYRLEVDANESVENLKARVKDKNGIENQNIIIIYSGDILSNGKTISQFNIKNDCILFVDFLFDSNINIKTSTGKIIQVSFDPIYKIKHIKLMITKRTGIPVDQQQLIFACQHLDDGKTLQDYNIQKHGILHLVLIILGGTCNCYFVELPNGEILCIRATPKPISIRDLKMQIWEKESIAPTRQKLTLNGKILEDDKDLVEYNILYYDTSRMSMRDSKVSKASIGDSKKLDLEILDAPFAEIFIQEGVCNVFSLHVNINTTTVEQLKNQIEKEMKIPFQQQHLFFTDV